MRDEVTGIEMVETAINGRWSLWLPPWRAERPQWDIANGGWERENLDAMHEVVKDRNIVVDVGAEEGDMSCLLGTWAREGVILLEPNPKVWPCTRMTFQANGVRPLDWFVGFASNTTEDGPKSEFFEDVDGWPSCAYDEPIPAHGFRHLAQDFDRTPQIRLDELLECTPDVITMDVEGAELRVLQGARRILTNDRPVVFVSVHPEFMRDLYEEEPGMLHQLMADHGYKSEHLATDHEEHWVFTP